MRSCRESLCIAMLSTSFIIGSKPVQKELLLTTLTGKRAPSAVKMCPAYLE